MQGHRYRVSTGLNVSTLQIHKLGTLTEFQLVPDRRSKPFQCAGRSWEVPNADSHARVACAARVPDFALDFLTARESRLLVKKTLEGKEKSGETGT